MFEEMLDDKGYHATRGAHKVIMSPRHVLKLYRRVCRLDDLVKKEFYREARVGLSKRSSRKIGMALERLRSAENDLGTSFEVGGDLHLPDRTWNQKEWRDAIRAVRGGDSDKLLDKYRKKIAPRRGDK